MFRTERFSYQVSELILRFDPYRHYILCLYTLSYKVATHSFVLCTLMKDRIVTNVMYMGYVDFGFLIGCFDQSCFVLCKQKIHHLMFPFIAVVIQYIINLHFLGLVRQMDVVGWLGIDGVFSILVAFSLLSCHDRRRPMTSLMDLLLWYHKESDNTERFYFIDWTLNTYKVNILILIYKGPN